MDFLLSLIGGVSVFTIIINIISVIAPLIIMYQLHKIIKSLKTAEENKYERHRELIALLIEKEKPLFDEENAHD